MAVSSGFVLANSLRLRRFEAHRPAPATAAAHRAADPPAVPAGREMPALPTPGR